MVFEGIFISWLGVVVGAVVYYVIGALWYSVIFGKRWMKLMDIKKKNLKKAMEKGVVKSYVYSLVAKVIAVYVLALFVGLAGVNGFVGGLYIGVLAWIGFFITNSLDSILWEEKPVELFMVNMGYHLVGLALAGGIVAVL